jgi:dTDP-glucose pyrophosphorylase
MKIIIQAGGKGTRLEHLTDNNEMQFRHQEV